MSGYGGRTKGSVSIDGTATVSGTINAVSSTGEGNLPPGVLVAAGKITGWSKQWKFGHREDQGAAEAAVWTGTADAYGGFLTAAATVQVAAGGDAADTDGGAGAHNIRIFGVDGNFAAISATLTLAGAGASVGSDKKFLRVNRSFVIDCGGYTYTAGGTIANNAGDITITTVGGTEVAHIQATRGQTQMAIWTVPSGVTAYFVGANLGVDANKASEFRLYVREGADDVTTPFRPALSKWEVDGVAGTSMLEPPIPIVVPGKSDVWMSAAPTGVGTNISVDMFFFLEDD